MDCELYSGELHGLRAWYAKVCGNDDVEFNNAINSLYELCGVQPHEPVRELECHLPNGDPISGAQRGVVGLVDPEGCYAVVRDGKVLGTFSWSARGGWYGYAMIGGNAYFASNTTGDDGKLTKCSMNAYLERDAENAELIRQRLS